MAGIRVELWGGPLDGQQLVVADPPVSELVAQQLDWPVNYAQDALEVPLRQHRYVYEPSIRRYTYAGERGG